MIRVCLFLTNAKKAFVKWKIRILAKRQKEGVFTSKTQKLKDTRYSITKPKNG
jgi:hypothetical protein